MCAQERALRAREDVRLGESRHEQTCRAPPPQRRQERSQGPTRALSLTQNTLTFKSIHALTLVNYLILSAVLHVHPYNQLRPLSNLAIKPSVPISLLRLAHSTVISIITI